MSERERLYITAHYYNGVERDTNKALETYELWKRTYPRDAVPHINIGTIYTSRGENERALESFLKALDLDPTRRLAYTNAFFRYLELDRVDAAEALTERQIQVTGETPDTNLQLFQIAARRRDSAAADRYAARLANTPLEMNFLQLRSGEMVAAGRLRESLQVHARLLELLKRHGMNERIPVVMANVASTAALLGETDLARQQALAAAAIGGSTPDLHANLAFTFAALGDRARARHHLSEFRKVPFDDAELSELGGVMVEALIALTTGEPATTVRLLAELPLEREVGLVSSALYTRAEAHRALGQWDDAGRDYRAILDRPTPGVFSLVHSLARLGVARTLAATGDLTGARREYATLLEEWKDADEDMVLLREIKADVAKLGS